MPNTTPAKRARRAPAARQHSSLDYVQPALEDLDKARGRAGEELRTTSDTAIERLRKGREGPSFARRRPDVTVGGRARARVRGRPG